MTPTISALIIAISVLLLALTASACTVVGFAVGAKADSEKSSTSYTWTNSPQDQLPQRGNLVEAYLKDGKVVKGKFQKIAPYEFDESTEVLMLKTEKRVMQIPLTGIEKVEVLAQKKNGKFIGLAIGAVIDVVVGIIALSTISLNFSI